MLSGWCDCAAPHSGVSPPPLPLALQRVFVEFFATGDAQKARHFDVQPFMDREQASIAKAQQGFLKYICQPVFVALAEYCPAVRPAVAHCAHNIVVLHELELRYHSTPLHGSMVKVAVLARP